MKTYSGLSKAIAILASITLMVIILISKSARAAGPWYVASSGNDSNDCLSAITPCATINAAIVKATAGDTIKVAAGTYTSNTGSEVVLLNIGATLSGGWDGTFTTQSNASIIDGGGARRGFTVEAGITAFIEHFVVRNSSPGQIGGGGIFNYGTLTANDIIVSGNTASGGGGIFNSTGTLTVTNSTISGNTALDGDGGGIYNYYGTITLNSIAISDNTGSYSGGGIYNSSGTITLNNSIVRGNITSIYSSGGIFNDSGTVTLNNSTVSANSGGGIANSSTGSLTLNNSTVSANTSQSMGGGIHNSGTATLQNSIITGNTGAGISSDCNGALGSLGYSLIGNTAGCAFNATIGDLLNVDAKLGPLTDSIYHPLLLDSPAINAGNPGGCNDNLGNPLLTDQRGFGRFGRCDMGAYELQPIAFSVKTVNKALALPSAPVTYTITLRNGGVSDITNVLVTDTLPISLTYNNNSLTATDGSYGYASGVITWTGSVNAGGGVTVTFGATVGQSVPLGTDVVNSAVINGAGEIFTRTAMVRVDFYRIYLPLTLRKYPRHIHGHVTQNGIAVAAVPLELRFYNGSSWSTVTSTTTDADGDYSFLGAPSLSLGQKYYVRYRNTGSTPGRLWVWSTRDLASYTNGSDISIGDFDIADIVLIAPANGATVSVPRTFQWTPRPATPSDVYEFDMYDPYDFDPYIFPVVGYIGNYALNSLPPGFNVGDLYSWEIWVYSPDGGYGISYETREVYFSNSGFSVTTVAQPTQPKTTPDLNDQRKSRYQGP